MSQITPAFPHVETPTTIPLGMHDFEHPAPFEPPPALSAWERRASAVQTQIAVALGLWPMPPRSPVEATVTGPIERPGYTVWGVWFESLPGHFVSGNLYRPVGAGPFPAVLSPHGHWKNGRLNWGDDAHVAKELASGAERIEAGARSPLQARCANLAQLGCAVFIYDMVGFADSTGVPHGEGLGDPDAVANLRSAMGLQIWNGLRALDWLAAQPFVDVGRIGVTGASSGALQSVVLAALDPRITATAAVAMIGLNKQGGCVCENAPLLRIGTSNVEFAATVAPRAIGFASCNDWTADFATRGLPQMRQVYDLYGASDRLQHTHVPFGHNCNVHSREFVYRFFHRHLRLSGEPPTTEQAYEPIPPDQLHVTAPPSRLASPPAIQPTPEQLRTALRVLIGAADLPLPRAGDDGETVIAVPPIADAAPADPRPQFALGYNRTPLAETAFGVVRRLQAVRTRRVRLSAEGDARLAAVLAAAIAKPAFERISLDPPTVDFATDWRSPTFVPGLGRYGGLRAVQSLLGS